MSRATTTVVRGFTLAHQRVDLELSLAHASAAGFTELQLVPSDEHLRTIHLHARQLSITHVSVQGRPADYSYRDLLKDLTLSDPADVHRYPELKRKLYVAASEGNGGELSILLPADVRPEPIQQVAGAPGPVEYAPITVRIHYTLANITEALRFVRGEESLSTGSSTLVTGSSGGRRSGTTMGARSTPAMVDHVYTEATCGDWARCWVPCVDSLWERCTWELSFTVPTRIGTSSTQDPKSKKEDAARSLGSNGLVTVICTGDLVEEAVHPSNSSRTRFTFAQTVPTSVQHLAFAAGPFSRHILPTSSTSSSAAATAAVSAEADANGGAGHSNHLDLVAFCLPGREQELVNSVSFARQALDYFSRDFGSYPFGSYKLVFVHEPLKDVHAGSSLSLYSDALLHPATVIDQAYETRHIIANSIATQWVGINIIPKWYADCWLTSSLASYITALFLRRLLGNNEYRFRLKKDCDQCAMWDVGMPPLYQPGLTEPPDEQFQPFLNLKGPLVLYLLDRRLCKMGASLGLGRVIPKIFLQALTGELVNNAISTSSFLRTCRKVSGADLRAFGEQWIYGSGCPRFALTASLNRKRLVIEMQIRQDSPAYKFAQARPDDSLYSNPVKLFEGQFTVRVHEADGTPYEHVLDLKKEVTKFDVPFNTKGRRTRRKTAPGAKRTATALAESKQEDGGAQDRRSAGKAAKANGEDDAANADASDGPVDLGFGFYAPFEDERERRRWKVADWTEEDDLIQANAPYEWIRLDADFEWICQVHFDQSDYMWHSQLERDRDVVAQVSAIAALAHMPSPITATVLTRTVLVDKYFYRVRMEAAYALVNCAVPQFQYLGLFLLLQLYRFKYCYDRYAPENEPLAVPSIPKANDFSNLPDYFIQRAIINAISRVRSPYGRTLPPVKHFLINLLRYNDNSTNRYSDDHFVASIVNALANAFVPIESPVHRRFFKAEEDPDAVGEELLLIEALNEVERLRELDVLISSYHSVVTTACMEWFSSMMLSNLLPVDLQLFLNYTEQGQATRVRQAAFAALLLLKGLHHKIVTPYVFGVLRADPSRSLRRALARGICEALAVELACGEFGDATECLPQLPLEEEGDAEEREAVKLAAELQAQKEYKAQTESNFRTLRREIGRSAAVREGFLGALLAPVPDAEVRWALIKAAEMLFKPADEKDLPFQSKTSVRVKLPSMSQTQGGRAEKERHPFIEVPDLPNRESFQKADVTAPRQIKLTLAPRKSAEASILDLPANPAGEATASPKKLKLKRPKPLAPEQASGMEKADLTACRNCLKKLRESKHATLFLNPVDPVRDRAPNYFAVIKRPMDLSTMSNKLDAGLYKDRFEFKADFELIISNALTFTPNPKMLVHQEALKFEKMFKTQWNRITNTLEQAKARQRIHIDLTGADDAVDAPPKAPAQPAPTAVNSAAAPIVIEDDHEPAPAAQATAPAPATEAKPAKPAIKIKLKARASTSESQTATPERALQPTTSASADVVPSTSAQTATPAQSFYPQAPAPSGPSTPVKPPKVAKPKTPTHPVAKAALTDPVGTAVGVPLHVKRCRAILQVLKKLPEAVFFLRPVDPVLDGVPTYYDEIKSPMDLGTMEKKLESGSYGSMDEFASDMELIWANCRQFNPPGSLPYQHADKMETAWRHEWAKALVPRLEFHEKRAMQSLLSRLKSVPVGILFLHPVDPVALNISTYFQVINKADARDLSTIASNLQADRYESVAQIEADLQLMLDNCYKFNAANEAVLAQARAFEDYYRKELASAKTTIAKQAATGTASAGPSGSGGGKRKAGDGSQEEQGGGVGSAKKPKTDYEAQVIE